MNKRIDELAKQAGWGEGASYDDCRQCSPFNPEEFAELIIEECIAQIQKDENGVAYEAIARIIDHFGEVK